MMEQWNNSPPPLSLWSRSDWAKRHSEIAKLVGHLPSGNAFPGDRQREEVADGLSVATTGHVEMDDAEGACPPPSFVDQLLSETFHDPTSSPGDYWNDTNGRSRQPCNYATPGRSDPTYVHHEQMGSGSDMSISMPDCERQDQVSSISKHGGTDSQACNDVGSALVEEPSAAAECDEITSATGPYNLPGDSSQIHASGVQYWRVEDSPLLEEGELSDVSPACRPAAGTQHPQTEDTLPAVTTEVDSQCGQPDKPLPAARHNARTLPPRNTFPGLHFRKGCNSQFLSESIGHPAVYQGPSNGWLDDGDY